METEKTTWERTVAQQRYEAGYNYCQKIGYYATVNENENMFIGKQWEGVKAKGLSTPVFNIEKRIGEYKISALASQNIKAVYGIEGVSQYSETEEVPEEELELIRIAKLMSGNADVQWERLKMDAMGRRWLRDGFVTGDMCAYTYWDSSVETGSSVTGNYVTERVNGSNVFFGNPNEPDSQKQPWIILKIRDNVQNLRDEAKKYQKENKLSDDEIMRIVGDTDTETEIGTYGQLEIDAPDEETQKCNAYLMFYRKDGVVYWSKSTEYVTIRPEVNNKTGKRYPIDWANWDEAENCYHGVAECSQIHPNQRFINKMFAMCMLWFTRNSLGKVAIDATRITSWSNDASEVIRVDGPVTNVMQQLSAGDFNNAILSIIDYAFNYTKECMGVTDAALGVERSDNTSALVINQRQSAMPLENQQSRFYTFIENIFLTWSSYMLGYYLEGRKIPYKDKDGNIKYETFTKKNAQKLAMNVKIDVGASSHWSEIASLDILKELLRDNRITLIQFLERAPKGYVKDVQKLIDEQTAIAEQGSEINDEQRQQQIQEMAAFFDTLPAEEQRRLQSLPDAQMEQEVMAMMQGT